MVQAFITAVRLGADGMITDDLEMVQFRKVTTAPRRSGIYGITLKKAMEFFDF